MEAIFQDGCQKYILSHKLFFPPDILGYKGHKTIRIFPKYMILWSRICFIKCLLDVCKDSSKCEKVCVGPGEDLIWTSRSCWEEQPKTEESSTTCKKKPNYSFLVIFLWFWQSMVTKMLRLSCICRKLVLLAYTWSDRLFCLFRHGFTTYSTQIRIKRTWIEITSITKNRVAEARTYCSCPNAPYE